MTKPLSAAPAGLCLIALMVTVLSTAPAAADCEDVVRGADQALVDRISPHRIWEQEDLYAGKIYKMLINFGWEFPERTEEFRDHTLATLLINHGVIGESPPVRQNPQTGDWEYDPYGLSFARTFHRSWDSYALLGFDSFATSCQDVNPQTGERFCDPARRGLFSSSLENFGVEVGTGVLDYIEGYRCDDPDTPCARAQLRYAVDLFRDPDRVAEYTCEVWDDEYGVADVASTIIHEQWHAASVNHIAGNKVDDDPNNNCNQGELSCDTFIWDATTSARMYGGLSRQAHEGVGSFQVESEFLCDLTTSPATWIPVQTKAVIQQAFKRDANRSRYVNIEADESPNDGDGTLPFTCNTELLSTFNVAKDGSISCTTNACQFDSQCNDLDPSTNDVCTPEACCEFSPICDTKNCQADHECDDSDPITHDYCGVNGCCVNSPVK